MPVSPWRAAGPAHVGDGVLPRYGPRRGARRRRALRRTAPVRGEGRSGAAGAGQAGRWLPNVPEDAGRPSAHDALLAASFRLAPELVEECGLRLAACGLRLAACGLRLAACGLRLAACGLRLAACGVRWYPTNAAAMSRVFRPPPASPEPAGPAPGGSIVVRCIVSLPLPLGFTRLVWIHPSQPDPSMPFAELRTGQAPFPPPWPLVLRRPQEARDRRLPLIRRENQGEEGDFAIN